MNLIIKTVEHKLADYELERIQSIKRKASSLIIEKYPEYVQLNILRLGGEPLVEMSMYIDTIRKISNEAGAVGTRLEDIIWDIESLGA